LEPRIRLLNADIDQSPDLASRFSIQSVPTLLLLKGGKEIARTSGAMNAQQIVDWAEQVVLTQAI
ncbi:MAG: thioredoxin family protein, partial [Geminicoccaceae bacterium]